MPPASCLSDQDLWRIASQETASERARGHLQRCRSCRRKLQRLTAEQDLLRQLSRSPAGFGPGSGCAGASAAAATANSDSALEQRLAQLVVRAAGRVERDSSEPSSSGSLPRHPLAGERWIGKYEIREDLGRGGQGVVFRAFDPALRRDVALKLSRVPLTRESHGNSRIAREGRLLARIEHPHLARVYDCGLHRNYPYLVMEFVRGVPLSDFAAFRPLPPGRIREILREVAGAVAAAHRRGILHLDLKPENVLVTAEGRCKLIDFGMGWLFARRPRGRERIIAGTFEYMAPEQLRGASHAWTPATDVYGLGGLLCFLLTGASPLPDPAHLSRSPAVELQRVRQRLADGGYDRRLSRICRRALAPMPGDRYRDAATFQRELDAERPPGSLGPLLAAAGALLVLTGIILLANDLIAFGRPEQGIAGMRPARTAGNAVSTDVHLLVDPLPPRPAGRQFFCWTPRTGALGMTRVVTSLFVDPDAATPSEEARLTLDTEGQLCAVIAIRSLMPEERLAALLTDVLRGTDLSTTVGLGERIIMLSNEPGRTVTDDLGRKHPLTADVSRRMARLRLRYEAHLILTGQDDAAPPSRITLHVRPAGASTTQNPRLLLTLGESVRGKGGRR